MATTSHPLGIGNGHVQLDGHDIQVFVQRHAQKDLEVVDRVFDS